MKVACITDDGLTISPHFGRAESYAVLTVEGGEIVGRELRPKLGHQQFGAQESHQDAHGRSGTSSASHDKHVSMAQAISDCEALLCRGMGYGAYQSMQSLGIRPVVTNETEIDAATLAYAEGRLSDHPEKLH